MCCWRTDVAASLSLPLCSRRETRFSQNPCPEERATAEGGGGGRRRAASGPQAPHPCPRQTPGGKVVTARSQSDCLAQGSRRPRAALAGDQDARGHWLRLPRRKAFATPGSQDCSGPWGSSHWTGCTWSRPALGEDARSRSLSVSSWPETPTLLWTKATPICFCCGLGRRMLKLWNGISLSLPFPFRPSLPSCPLISLLFPSLLSPSLLSFLPFLLSSPKISEFSQGKELPTCRQQPGVWMKALLHDFKQITELLVFLVLFHL